jgi:hypothetical protein
MKHTWAVKYPWVSWGVITANLHKINHSEHLLAHADMFKHLASEITNFALLFAAIFFFNILYMYMGSDVIPNLHNLRP